MYLGNVVRISKEFRTINYYGNEEYIEYNVHNIRLIKVKT